MKDAYAVFGLGFGDEGKGRAVDYLTDKHKATLGVRFNGGAQAYHNVEFDGRFHGFRMFTAGSFAGAETLLTHHVIVDPFMIMIESLALQQHFGGDWLSKMHVDGGALVVTEYHKAVSRKDPSGHGTTGMGIGEAQRHRDAHPSEAIYVGDLFLGYEHVMKLLIEQQRRYKLDYDIILDWRVQQLAAALTKAGAAFDICSEADILNAHDTVIFEGAQGFLLDPVKGFPPNVTSTRCDQTNVTNLIHQTRFTGAATFIGCTRSYQTRHGIGKFPTEGTFIPPWKEAHNDDEGVQGKFRTGALDLHLLKYACDNIAPDYLFVSHMDWWTPLMGQARIDRWGDRPAYQHPSTSYAFLGAIEKATQTEVRYLGYGPKRSDVKEYA